MLAWFERRVDPFPETISSDMPRTFFAFLWECSAGVRPYLLWMTLLTAAIGAFEALLFSMLGRLIDWLGASGPAHFFEEQRTRLWLLAGILVASPLLIAVQAWLKYQTIQPVFPMRLRWIFHRRMLNQSLSFFQDEFAGRIAAKVMQTALALRLNGISHWIMWELATLFENIGTVQDGIRTLSHHTTVTDPENATPLLVARGEIRFENVRFHYGGEKRVIEELSLVIKPGERIGLVGRSGAGKSTVVNLLLRFYDIEAGRILIDGQNIATATQESLRQQIGMVTQDTSCASLRARQHHVWSAWRFGRGNVRGGAACQG